MFWLKVGVAHKHRSCKAAAINKTILFVNSFVLLVYYKRITKIRRIVSPFEVCLTFEDFEGSSPSLHIVLHGQLSCVLTLLLCINPDELLPVW